MYIHLHVYEEKHSKNDVNRLSASFFSSARLRRYILLLGALCIETLFYYFLFSLLPCFTPMYMQAYIHFWLPFLAVFLSLCLRSEKHYCNYQATSWSSSPAVVAERGIGGGGGGARARWAQGDVNAAKRKKKVMTMLSQRAKNEMKQIHEKGIWNGGIEPEGKEEGREEGSTLERKMYPFPFYFQGEIQTKKKYRDTQRWRKK